MWLFILWKENKSSGKEEESSPMEQLPPPSAPPAYRIEPSQKKDVLVTPTYTFEKKPEGASPPEEEAEPPTAQAALPIQYEPSATRSTPLHGLRQKKR